MIDSAFKKLKTNLDLNDNFDDLIQQKHKAVRSVIEKIDPSIETKLIGSLQRQTKIKPINGQNFDIDILAILGSFDRWVPAEQGISIHDAMRKARNIIGQSERYDSMNPEMDNPTIIFEHKDGIKVEIVPAYIDNIGYRADGTPTVKGRGYWVPKSSGWELADYDHEAKHLTEMNGVSKEMLVPLIKMLKALKNMYFPVLESFHLEILATQTIPGAVQYNISNNIPNTFNALVRDFFALAKEILHLNVRMGASNSPAMSLSPENLIKIRNMFNSILNYCETVERYPDERQKVNAWKELFGKAMPSLN